MVYIYIYIYLFMMSRWYEKMVLQWWLRSTTGSYGRTYVEATYREIMIHSTMAIFRDVSSRRMVGVLPWYITHSRHTRVNTSVGTVYDIFWFSWYKNLYVLCFQIYMYYKRNTGGLWLRPNPTMFREGFWSPMHFKEKINPQTQHCFTVIRYMMVLCLYAYIYSLWFHILFFTPSSLNLVGFCLLFPSLSTWFCSLPFFPFFRLGVGPLFYVVVDNSLSQFLIF